MRADRLISIMLQLQVHGHMTAKDLSERLEVSQRTIYRDMDALSMAGIPVVAERGVGGGWFLLDSYRANLTGLSEAEIQTLFLSTPDRVLDDLGMGQASEMALNKLLATIPETQRRDAEYIRQRIYIDAGGWNASDEDVSYLPTFQQAVWQERKVDVTYHLSTGPIIEAVLDPLGLVARGSTWYLVAAFEGDVCVYRVSRMLEVELIDEPCERPASFNLSAFWTQSSADFKTARLNYEVVIRTSPAVLPRIQQMICSAQAEDLAHAQPDALSRCEVTLQFETEDKAYRELLALGHEVEVLAPQPLRHRIIDAVERMAALYRKETPTLMPRHREPMAA